MALEAQWAWRCQNCGHIEIIFCGECNNCSEDKGYKKTVELKVIR